MQPQVKKQVLRELEILHHCESPYIVTFYGAFLSEPDVCMCMEHMDIGSLDAIYRKHGPIEPPILGKITVAVGDCRVDFLSICNNGSSLTRHPTIYIYHHHLGTVRPGVSV